MQYDMLRGVGSWEILVLSTKGQRDMNQNRFTYESKLIHIGNKSIQSI